ncbi:hypothetical protein MALG_02082 [Marinovum algicola DG 898]|nr:hypothetical protein MALG_02082 [Marinovum algicola DG 898]
MGKVHNRRVPADANAADILRYIPNYIEAYRQEYQRLIILPPNGPGLPQAPLSPYLQCRRFEILLAKDGVVIFVADHPPKHDWWIAGGPALKVDYEPSRTPKWVTAKLSENGLLGKPIGIYRIVSKQALPERIWSGDLPAPIKQTTLKDGSQIHIMQLECDIDEAVAQLTFGAFGRVLDVHLERNRTNFWKPHIISGMGFFNAGLTGKRFCNYIEVLPHIDRAAWDTRTITLRAAADVRRDFARFTGKKDGGATFSFGEYGQWVESYQRSLHKLWESIIQFEALLATASDAVEEVFHQFLVRNPMLLDPIGDVVSKPRLAYPNGKTSPDGKTYVEPDFIVASPSGSYRLIEIERASKNLATKAGHARQDLAQAAFQIAEWKQFIAQNYHVLEDRFPNISENSPSAIILSRASQNGFESEASLHRKVDQLKRQFNVDEILTYDDVLKNARSLYDKLSNLGL